MNMWAQDCLIVRLSIYYWTFWMIPCSGHYRYSGPTICSLDHHMWTIL